MELQKLLLENRAQAIDEAVSGLSRAALPHYAADTSLRSRDRLERLYDLCVECIAGRSLVAISEHARQIARERHREGFGLHEVHTAFNVLEEVLWRMISKRLPPTELFGALAQVSTVLGAGKQALAIEYVHLAGHPEAKRTLDVSELFKGTN
jgi:hypothetical protein